MHDRMNEVRELEHFQVPERSGYEFHLDRRKFFQVMGSGLAIFIAAGNNFANSFPLEAGAAPEDSLAAWIHIGENGVVTVYSGKAEVGQNVRTTLTQVVAEELRLEVDQVEMVLGDTDLTPFDMGTFGSMSVPRMVPKVRKAAATARELLIDIAAKEWGVERSSLNIANGEVKATSGKAVPIGQLLHGKEFDAAVNENILLTPVDQWKVAGTSIPKIGGRKFVTGGHKYVSDMKLPGMLYGKVLRPPAFGATLVSADLSAVKALADVIAVEDGNFVGVAAPDVNTAAKAVKLIKAEWKTTPQPSRSEIFEYLKKNAGSAKDNDVAGDAAGSYAQSAIKLEHSFYIDYIAHAPLEPRSGLAQWVDGKLTVWTGTQRPFGVHEELMNLFHLEKGKVRVIQPDTGSGYGGKHTGEAGIEAARLSKAAGKPVHIQWTREEEFTWAYFRPAGVIDIKAGANKEGYVTSWEFHNYNSGPSGIDTPYDIVNKKIQFHSSNSPLRQGSYRGLAATANVFARESIMNDLALELKMDQLEFRLKNLLEPRMKNVLEAAAKQFGWNVGKIPSGHGVGIACGNEKGSYVATCAEVSVGPGDDVKVLRVVASFECGKIINPNHLENQIQGSVIQGMGGALFEKIDFKDGRILNAAFSKYRVPRFGDIPELEVVMLDRKDIPSVGAGETPILGIAPAIRNAIVNATGKKLYTLPLTAKAG